MLLFPEPPDTAFLKGSGGENIQFIHPPCFRLQSVVELLRLFFVPRVKRLSNSFA